MKNVFRNCLFSALVCASAVTLSAQNQRPAAPAQPTLQTIDAENSRLANLVGQKLSALNPQKNNLNIRVGYFSLSGSGNPLGNLWASSLAGNLCNASGGGFTVVMGQSAVDYTLSGEIILAGGTVRVFTQLIKHNGQSLAASWTNDIPFASIPAGLLSASPASSGSRAMLYPDSYEADDGHNPVQYAEAADDNGWVSRTIHTEGDEDWFLVRLDKPGTLTLETSGSMDTEMALFDAANPANEPLEEDDDGGNGGNSRITRDVAAGESYLVRVTGYDNEETGNYRFRAALREEEPAPPAVH